MTSRNTVSNSNFVVPVADLDRGAKTVSWPIPVAWLENVLDGLEAKPRGEPGTLTVELSKNGNQVMVRGHAEVAVVIPCVVTLDPLNFDLRPELFLMLSPAPAAPPAGGTGRSSKRRSGSAPRGGGAENTTRAGHSRGKGPSEAWAQDPELRNEDAARDLFHGDKIVLDDFLREFILLELPAYPRRSDLPLDESPARGTPPPAPEQAADPAPTPVDPRLQPLAEIRDRLRQTKKE